MLKKLILATVVLAMVSPNAFADPKKKVPPPKPKIETTKPANDTPVKGLDPGEMMLQFEIQGTMSTPQ